MIDTAASSGKTPSQTSLQGKLHPNETGQVPVDTALACG
jgi:hypothetical protein